MYIRDIERKKGKKKEEKKEKGSAHDVVSVNFNYHRSSYPSYIRKMFAKRVIT